MLAHSALVLIAALESGSDDLSIVAQRIMHAPAAEAATQPLDERGRSFETANGVAAVATSFELIIARIGADGKPVLACTDDEAGARKFLASPVDKLPTTRAQEK